MKMITHRDNEWICNSFKTANKESILPAQNVDKVLPYNCSFTL